MATSTKTKQKDSKMIAAYVAKYSNSSTGANYRGAIEAFLRGVFNLAKNTADNKRAAYDYEDLLVRYLADKTRNHNKDFTVFTAAAVEESVSKQSARQRITYARKFLRDKGVNISQETVDDLKREAKGGAATIRKAFTNKILCQTITGADVRSRALFLVLASSGMRLDEALSLDESNIDWNTTPVKISLREDQVKNKIPRFTFISSEAAQAFKAFLKVRHEFIKVTERRVELLKNGKNAKGSKASVKTELLFAWTDSSVNKAWESMLRKAGYYSRDSKSGRNQYRIHGLRAFFLNTCKRAGMAEVIAEGLAGHTGHPGTMNNSYRDQKEEEDGIEYLKVEKSLIICVPEEAKKAIELANSKIADLQTKTAEQAESIDDVRALNVALREQIKVQQKQMTEQRAEIADMKKSIEGLVLKISRLAPSLFEESDINSLPDSIGVRE